MADEIPGRRALLPLTLALLLVAGPGGATAALEGGCRPAGQPAATLLFPYFEVDLASFRGPATLIDIVNRDTEGPVLAHVTLWTDWAVPTGGFDVFLGPGDVLPISLRDLLTTGQAPETGPGASAFPGCPDTLGGAFAAPSMLERAHTGRATSGVCLGSARPDPDRAVGFVTVDVVRRCGAPTDPASPGYFAGEDSKAGTANLLWGNYYLVEPLENFAQGATAVHVVADPAAFEPGDTTFYGPWIGSSAADGRAPLPSEWRARYLELGRNGESELLVWRAPVDPRGSGVACGTAPGWVPLGEEAIVGWDEEGVSHTLPGIERPVDSLFPRAVQRVRTGEGILPPGPAGWFELDLDLPDGTSNQAWVAWRTRVAGRFSVGQSGVALNDLCAPEP